jgi:hypothetical protein
MCHIPEDSCLKPLVLQFIFKFGKLFYTLQVLDSPRCVWFFVVVVVVAKDERNIMVV